MKRLALYTLSAVLMLAGEPAVGATNHPTPAPRGPGALLLAPFGLIASMTSSWLRTPTPLDNSALLDERDGWRDVVLDVRDHGWGLMLEVKGAAEFDRSTILLADGARLDLDLTGARRADGLFSLAEFVGDREVVAVGLRARARGDRAFVGVRLLRPAGTSQGVPNGTER